MITYKTIRELVEAKSGYPNLKDSSRHREFADVKKVYQKLCRVFINGASLQRIAGEINLVNHATVLSNIKRFDELYGTESFTANCLYRDCLEILNEIAPEKSADYFFMVNAVKNEQIKELYEENYRLKLKNKELTTQLQTEIAKGKEVIFEVV